MTQESFRSYREQNDAKSEGDNDSEGGHLHVSMETIKRRVSLLRKPRNLLSTQETISVDHSYNRNNHERSVEDVEIMLPSLYKKTGSKFGRTRRGPDLNSTKTLEVKESSKGDYLAK